MIADARAAGRATAAGLAGRRRWPGAACAHALDQQHRLADSVIAAPPISIRWVGPQRVTSWPKRRCQMSSSGKPIRAKAPQAVISTPPTGAYQSPAIRTAAGPGRSSTGSADREQPAAKMPNRPARMR